MLKANPYDRRCVIGMWDPDADLGATSKDIPCNDLIKCSMRGQTFEDRALDIHVYCRSNDIIWGCYGANAVHMSMLHEYLAAQIGVAVGHYYQISGDWHAYLDQPYHLKDFEHDRPDVLVNPYESGRITTMPLVTHPASFDAELAIVMLAVQNRSFDRLDCTTMRNAFFRVVAQPMYILHALWKEKKLEELGTLAARYTMHETNIDWLVSARDWIERRLLAKSARIARDMLNAQPIPRAVTFGGNMEDS
jgi:hypothetical protein